MNLKRKVICVLLTFFTFVNCNVVFADTSNDIYIFNGHSYKVIDDRLSWSDAKKYCEDLGGHLATITSKEENDFIFNTIKNRSKTIYWLGAEYNNKDKLWHWITNEEWKYNNWSYGNPDHYNHGSIGYEEYLGILRVDSGNSGRASQWNDFVNMDAFWGKDNVGFICEWETETVISVLPTLEENDALQFLGFLYNDSSIDVADVENDDYYKLITGKLDKGSEHEKNVQIAFLQFVEMQTNRYIADNQYKSDYIRNGLLSYMEKHYLNKKDIPEEEYNKLVNEQLNKIEDAIVGGLCSTVAKNTGIVVTQEVIDNIELAKSAYSTALELPKKIEKFVDSTVVATQLAFAPLAAEMTGRYTYFNCYISCRDMGTPDDLTFQLAMDYNMLAIKENNWATGIMNCIPGKSSWTENTDKIDRWAEYIYNLKNSINVNVVNVVIDKVAADVNCKDSITLTPNIFPVNSTDQSVTWTSSDPSIATVENGVVTTHRPGNVVISAETSDGLSSECNITVEGNSTLLGDVDCDNKLTLIDAILILKYYNNEIIFGQSDIDRADCDDNGVVNNVDSAMVLKGLAVE